MNNNQSDNLNNPNVPKTKPLSLATRFRHFLRWCAGADNRLLDQCPGEQLKFSASGMMVIIISCVAIVSFNFFFNQNFDASPVAALFGGFGGAAVIYNIDRLVLVFHRKGPGEWLRAIPRLLLTVALSFVLMDPLILHSFKREIDVQMRRTSQTVVTEAREVAAARYQKEKDELTVANQTLQTQLDNAKQFSEQKRKELIGEIEGATGSGIPGRGKTAGEKQTAFDEANAEYKSLKAEVADKTGKNNQRLQDIQQAVENEVKLVAEAQSNATGGLARHQALFAIIFNNPSALLKVIPLFLVCFLFENLPLMLKLSSKPGKYDALVEAEEADGRAEVEEASKDARENQKRFREAQTAVAERIKRSVANGTVNNLSGGGEKEMAGLFQLVIFRNLARDLFGKDNSKRQPEFGANITIAVVNQPDWKFVLQPPASVSQELTLANLDGDLEEIIQSISVQEKKHVAISKITNSKGFEIWNEVPLLPQLEADAKILLTLAPKIIRTNEAGLAP